mgnify:CR=1 FL=1
MSKHFELYGPYTGPMLWKYRVLDLHCANANFVTDAGGTHIARRMMERINALSLRDVDTLLAWDKIKQYDLVHPVLKERRPTLVYDRDYPPLPHLPYDRLRSSSASLGAAWGLRRR